MREFWLKLSNNKHPIKNVVCFTEPQYLGAYGDKEFYTKTLVREVSPDLDSAVQKMVEALEKALKELPQTFENYQLYFDMKEAIEAFRKAQRK